MSSIYQPYAVKLHTDEMGSAVLLGGISQQSLMADAETSREVSAGSVDPFFGSVDRLNPKATVTTYAIAKAIDAIGLRGLKITSATNAGVVFYFAKIDPDTGQALAGSTHISRTIKSGLLYPQRLTVDHQGQASLTLGLATRWDGTNDAITVATSVALPTVLADDERFTLGSATVAGVTVDRKSNLDVDFGLTVEQISTDGATQPAYLHIAQALARATIRGLNPDDFSASGVPLLGKAGSHANTIIQFRKRAANTAGFASGSVNITMTMAGSVFWESMGEAQGNQRVGSTLVIEPTHDGTNLPITVDTAAAAI